LRQAQATVGQPPNIRHVSHIGATLYSTANQPRLWIFNKIVAKLVPPHIKPPFYASAAGTMAVNRIRGAFAVPRKGETFELRAGLV
jgi:hypothetical protein